VATDLQSDNMQNMQCQLAGNTRYILSHVWCYHTGFQKTFI